MSNYSRSRYEAIEVGCYFIARAARAVCTRDYARAEYAGDLGSSPSATRRAYKKFWRRTRENHSRWTTKRWANCLNCGNAVRQPAKRSHSNVDGLR